MSFTISPSTPFSKINWDTFQDRPPINKSMPFCKEKDWYNDVKCCMSGYTIEHVRDMAYDSGNQATPEALFLDQYPCLNGVELDYFVERVTSTASDSGEKESDPQAPILQCISETVFQALQKILPKSVLDSIEPYLCQKINHF